MVNMRDWGRSTGRMCVMCGVNCSDLEGEPIGKPIPRIDGFGNLLCISGHFSPK